MYGIYLLYGINLSYGIILLASTFVCDLVTLTELCFAFSLQASVWFDFGMIDGGHPLVFATLA
jgi:hypothetical protein